MTGAAFEGAQPPALLRQLKAWLLWGYVPNGDKKPRKLPRYANGRPRGNLHGTPTDLGQLVTFDEALAAATARNCGIGLALTGTGVAALDFDACVQDGQVLPEVAELVRDTYAEISPSGQGVRAFYLDPAGELSNRKSPAKDGRFGYETFTSTGFVTVTGQVLPFNDLSGAADRVAPISPALRAFHASRFPPRADTPSAVDAADVAELAGNEGRLGMTLADMRRLLDVLPNTDLAYEDESGLSWLGVGMALHHESGGDPAAFELWDDWSRESPKYSTREYGLQRWESFGRYTEKPITMASLRKAARDAGTPLVAGIEDFEVLADELAPVDAGEAIAAAPVDKPGRFRVIPALEFAQRPSPDWIVKGVLPRAELVVLFGESGSGKSFIALDLAGAVCRGQEWRGKRVKQGRVVYVAAEGAGGFRNRLVAWAEHQQVDLAELPLGVVHAAPNLLLKPEAIELAQHIGRADVVILDTFAQTTPGANENAGEDMGMALRHCRGIHLATGATVVLVHHAGKDLAKGSRGWSGIKGAADAQLEVRKFKTGRVLIVEKQKDGEDGQEFGFALHQVPIGFDSDGDAITSCVVVEAQVVAPSAAEGKGGAPSKWGPVVMEVVREIALGQSEGIEIDAVVAEVVSRADTPPEKVAGAKKSVRRAIKALAAIEDGPFEIEGDCLTMME